MLVSRGASSIWLISISRSAVFELRTKLSRQILAAPLRRLEELGAPRLVASLTDDIPSISNALVSIPMLCMHVAVVLTGLVYTAWLSWPIFLGVLGFMVVSIFSYQLPLVRGSRYLDLSRQELDNLMKHITGLTDGAKELKLHRQRRDAFLNQELEPTAEAIRKHGFVADITFTIAAIWGRLLIFILIGLLIFGLPAVTTVSLLTLTGYTLVFLYLMTPLEAIMNILPIIGQANVALAKIEELGLTLQETAVENMKAVVELDSSAYHTLELRGVKHAYYREDQESTFQLGPI
jgi:putative ATP-binding cassette transporter